MKACYHRVLSSSQSNKTWSADLAAQIAAIGASIKRVVHERAFASPDFSSVIICTVETRNHKHLAQLRTQLKSRGIQKYETK